MRAIRLHEYGGPEVLRYEADVPAPSLAPNGVLIDVTATSVNPVDWKIRSGARQKDFPLQLPAILGKDVSGLVSEVGSEVRDFQPGDRVLALADATYAEQVAVPAALLTRLPDGLDPFAAAALPLVALTGEQLVRLATQVEAGQTILISGALGSVGRAAAHAAVKRGARVIAGVRARQRAEAEALGAAEVVALDDEAALAALDGIDGVADTVGGDIAARLLRLVRPGGRFGYASVLPEEAAAGRLDVTITRVFAKPDPATLRAFAEDLRDGRFVLPVSRTVPLRDAAAAQARLEQGGGGKVVLAIADPS